MARHACAIAFLAAALLSGCHSDTAAPEEAPGGVPLEVVQWLQANAIPFRTARAEGSFSDLEPLKPIIGNARIVAMGEATHGTREFFEMKHRVFEFLVREMGFTIFAIEAEWAEATRINDYIHNGQGDAHALLTGLYFWTWRTQEVLDLIEWMRRYNADAAHTKKLSFVGVDAQFPTMAMDRVIAYLRQADPSREEGAAAAYACLRPYSNNAMGATAVNYTTVNPAQRDVCAVAVKQIHDYMQSNEGRLVAASTQSAYDMALRAARLVVQGEDVRAFRTAGGRDAFMAENAAWWLDRAEPGEKMLVWAHNFHVSTASQAMGLHLRNEFGTALRVVGFSFFLGAFTAVDFDALTLGTHTFGPGPAGGYERYFHSAGLPRFILDLRVPTNTPATSWLAGPRAVREIGCCHRPSLPDWGVRSVSLPALYDVIIHFEETSASRLLPARWP